VYVNPAAAAAQSGAVQQQQNEAVELLTQTVYGFLDFTTTIGNTVMVFSPQSALAGRQVKLIVWPYPLIVTVSATNPLLILCPFLKLPYKE
jgi:hypothetical protein